MYLSPDVLSKILFAIATTQVQELGCDECYAQMDRFIELQLAGKPASELLPLVKEHLARCADCEEEYLLLLDILASLA